MSVGSRLFTAVGVLLAAAAVAGRWADLHAGGTGPAGRTVVALVGVVAAACGVVAAVAGTKVPDAVDPDAANAVVVGADAADVEAVLFAPVSYAAAAVVVGGAASVVGVAAAQPWLTWIGILAAVVGTARQVVRARSAGRTPG